MNKLILSLLFSILVVTCKEYENKEDRYIIACHSTDFTCFERQYQALRDNVLLGNQLLAINFYEPYVFRYGDTGTCVKISGVEESILVAISLDSNTKEYSMVLELPIKLQQIRNNSIACEAPDREFDSTGLYNGTLKKFEGNATMTVSYPYTLHKRNGKVYMSMEEESMDVMLDMPDHSAYDKESKLFEWSEWAYDMIQHMDVAQHSLAPYTGQLRKVLERLPLEKFLLLYPEEEYSDIHFSFPNTVSE